MKIVFESVKVILRILFSSESQNFKEILYVLRLYNFYSDLGGRLLHYIRLLHLSLETEQILFGIKEATSSFYSKNDQEWHF